MLLVKYMRINMNNLELITIVLEYVDEHLEDEISFDSLSSIFGYSPFHFHRLFASVTGLTTMEYLRKRRLMRACYELKNTHKNIADICYDCGFNSIQTFNRIFKEIYNLTPSAIRKKKIDFRFIPISDIISGYKKRIIIEGEYAMEPRFIEKEEFILAGIKKHTKNGFQVIGESWNELKERMGEFTNRINPKTTYGFEDYSEDFNKEPLSFFYMASVEVSDETNIPEGMCVKKIPKSLYAVFTVNGNNSNNEIAKAFKYIYDVWLPNSEYSLADEVCADFEFYDERWDCQSKLSQIDIYIPVKK